MLLKYSVSNFRSIGHNIEFSMLPLEDIQDDRFLTEIETVAGTWKVLKRGVLFGPNASGKTSFIDSIWYAVNYITKGPQNGFMKKVNQFRGNIPDLEGVTTFQFLIYADKNVYQYGFSLDKTQVFEEWLHILSGKEFSPLFERITNKDKKTEITIFPKYGRINSKERALAEILKESIKEKQANQLFLYKLAENGSIKVDPVFSWFKSIQVIYPSSKIHALPLRIQTDKDFREFLSIKLHSLDTGVNQVSVATNKMELSELIDKFELPDEIVHDIEEIQNGILNLNGKYFIFSEGYTTLVECVLETGRTHQIRAHMKHIGHPLFNDDRYGGDQILRGERSASYKAFIQNCQNIWLMSLFVKMRMVNLLH